MYIQDELDCTIQYSAEKNIHQYLCCNNVYLRVYQYSNIQDIFQLYICNMPSFEFYKLVLSVNTSLLVNSTGLSYQLTASFNLTYIFICNNPNEITFKSQVS